MRSYFLTREDIVGSKPFDSIKWLFETHLMQPDENEYHFAMLIGPNEDAPERIELWRDEPTYQTPADKIWYAGVNTEHWKN